VRENALMWNPVHADVALLQVIGRKIQQIHAIDHRYLPDFSLSPALLLSSDYSGEHRESPYLALSFLILPLESWRAWEQKRQLIRERYRAVDRRVGYARFAGVKRLVSMELLNAVGMVDGLLITVLIRKNVKSILDASGVINKSQWAVSHCENWKPQTLEKMLRVVHFVAFMIAGVSSPDQDVRWITDQDDIAPNEERFNEMAQVFRMTASRYLPHKLGLLSCWTTAESSLGVEDFAAIPDLAGGALVDLFGAYARQGITLSESLVIPHPEALTSKPREILAWFGNDSRLRRLVYTIEPGPSEGTIEVKDTNVGGVSLLVP
jgi:hypothetical protein